MNQQTHELIKHINHLPEKLNTHTILQCKLDGRRRCICRRRRTRAVAALRRVEAGEAAAQLGQSRRPRRRRLRRVDRSRSWSWSWLHHRDVRAVHAAVPAAVALLPEQVERVAAVGGGGGDGHPLDEALGVVAFLVMVAVERGAELHQLGLELGDLPVLLRLRLAQPHGLRQLGGAVRPRRGPCEHRVERARPRVPPREELLEPEDLLHRRGDRRVLVLRRRLGPVRRVHHRAGFNPRRDEERGHADAEGVEAEQHGGGADDAVRGGDAGDRGGHVVEEAAVLIVGDDEQRLVPLRAGAERLVDLLDEALALRDVVGRVVVVAGEELEVEVALLDDDVVGELALPAVALERHVVRVVVAQVLELPHVPACQYSPLLIITGLLPLFFFP
uniref:Uncharacterized protein n=1 Tax=Oryza brachyantha TaxID=4533 RepID=J3N9D1_ORYBR